MILFENIQLALEGLRANKMRALLTMLGIIIGISSVIAIVTVGDSLSGSVNSSFMSLGATNFYLSVQERDQGTGPQSGPPAAKKIPASDLVSDDMLEKYMDTYGDKVTAYSMSESAGLGIVKDNRLYANVTLSGTTEGYPITNNLTMLKGRFLNPIEVKSKKYVAVVSDKLVNNMFKKEDNPIGKEIRVSIGDSIESFTIIGVYKYDPSAFLGVGKSADSKDVRTDMYIPIKIAKQITSADSGYNIVTITGRADVDTASFAKQTEKFFNRFYVNNTRYEVSTITLDNIASSFNSVLGTVSIAVAVIAGISLVVGGIGVMNIMLVSVTERTREIGTRKALGARSSSIRIQFIVEAVIICSIGGLIGISLGVLFGYIGSSLLDYPSFPSVSIIIISFFFSMITGVFFGYYPANKAAKLDPIEALRYE